jgi:UDP-N-acetylglucosamine/UDP-N-acetylgalactosamine diphosphorylase
VVKPATLITAIADNDRHCVHSYIGTLPCFTMEGKILMDDKHKVAVSPDGNGGIYHALHNKGVIKSLKERGILYSHCYGVDNCLAKVADPIFIGYSVSKNTDCGVKVVRKAEPEERVGVVCLRNKKYGVVEYSEISKELSEMRKPDGSLALSAANIVNHFFSTEFLEGVLNFADELEYHIARKKIKHVDLESGELVTPKAINGMKLECFIFDVFPYAHNLSVLEVDRKEEFSPLKNAPGSATDGPETSRRDLLAQHLRFIQAAGGKVVGKNDGDALEVEISPLVSYSGEGLESVADRIINAPALINTVQDLAKFSS